VKITDIRVDGFGVWNETSVDELSDGVTLFYGRNEAGKTTLMQFIRAALYGFSAERRKLYLPPVYGGEPGGLLRVENHNGPFVIERRMSDRTDSALGRAVVLAANGSRQGQHLLNVLLSGVDESIFNNVFAVGIRELQELATLNDTEAAELLYNLASGVDRVSLVEVMRDLESARHKLLGTDDAPGHINRLLVAQEKLVAEIGELEMHTRRWSDLAAERVALANEVTQLEQRIAQLEHDSRTVEISIKVRDKWTTRRQIEQELVRCGEVEPLPEGCVERLDQLNLQLLEQTDRVKPIRQKRLEIRRQLAAQPINRVLWDECARIEAVCEHGPWIESLEHEIKQLRAEMETFEVELLNHEEKVGAEGAVKLANSPIVTARIVQQLQPAALSLREATKKRIIAHKQQKKHRLDEEKAKSDLKDELNGKGTENLDEALERTGQLVNHLRRRVKIEDRLEQMWRQQEEQDGQYQDILDVQLERVRILFVIGFMFVFGFVLMLTGMFGWKVMPMSAEVSWGVGFLGVICIGLSAAWKMVLEKTGQDELDASDRGRDALEREIEDLTAERDEIDAQLPSGVGNFTARLAAAEKEHKELEAMAPLHQQRVDARKRIQESRRHTTGVDEELREARGRWRRGLRQAGLPDSLTPKHVRQLASHHQKKSKIEEQIVRRRDRLAKLEANRNSLVERLQKLHHDVGINAVSQDPQVQLSQLSAALDGQREMVTRRRDLQKEERELRKQLATDLQEMRRLRRSREALFAESRVTDEPELRARVEKIEHVADLQKRKHTLSEQIVVVVGGHCTDADIERELDTYNPENLKRRWDDLVTRLHDSQTHIGQLHQRRGEINQEMKSLGENRRLSVARFELSCIRKQLSDAACEWRTVTTTWHLLEQVRETYEAERQPETLDEASMYLERLTRGKYTRVWTPLGRHELRVDDQDGKALSLDVLSRGTREAVFLSLRLALVASYGRRGVNIPMVLDDVLVNLDAHRAEAAVSLLCDFARESRQLLFFTCHDHIREMFQRADVDIRILPGHGTPGTRIVRQQMPVIAAQPAPLPEPAPVPEAVEKESLPEPVAEEPAGAPGECEPPAAVEAQHDEDEYVLRDEDNDDHSPLIQLGDFDTEDDELPLNTDESVDAEYEDEPEEDPVPAQAEDVDELFADADEGTPDCDGPWWSFGHGLEREGSAA
jgi:uncharacterized protein YhaN